MQKFKQTRDLRYICQSELNKACFQHDMANGGFKDLTRRTGERLIKYCIIKHLILLKIQNMMDIKRILAQWFINFLIKKTAGGAVKNNLQNEELAKELHKPIIRKFEKKKITIIFYRQYLRC